MSYFSISSVHVIERIKWEKNNQPSFFQSIVAFDNKWMNPFPTETSYEKNKTLAMEKLFNEAQSEIDRLRQNKSLRLNRRQGVGKYEIYRN